ncbi:MAG TPA: TRAP transporter small permease [Clostridia bacterium]|nr:TRAP transporter small permease [Clostridia bacterium]
MENRTKLTFILVNLDLIFTGITLVALVLLTFAGVIMRYFFNDPIMWQEEIQITCILWVVFLSTGAVFRTVGHVSIEIFVDMMPKKIARIIELLGYLVVMVVLIYTMLRGFGLVQQLFETERSTNILHVPYGLLYLSLPIGCILMIINYTAITLKKYFPDRYSNKPEIIIKDGEI